jgi:hypothetical protein
MEQSLEKRVAVLEDQVAELRSLVGTGRRVKDWRRTVGMFSGDEVMKRITDYALAYREKDREKARRGRSQKRKGRP